MKLLQLALFPFFRLFEFTLLLMLVTCERVINKFSKVGDQEFFDKQQFSWVEKLDEAATRRNRLLS